MINYRILYFKEIPMKKIITFFKKLFGKKEVLVQMRKIKCGCTDDTCGCR